MWTPTHVVLTVKQATGLLIKGQKKSNNCFVTISLEKAKFQTSVKVKAGSTCEWLEECELPIPDQGNTAEIILTCLHRNFLGVDEFLGRVIIPLSNFNIYEKPKYLWYTLESKPGKENKKDRGKIEAKVAFTVKAGSLSDLSKKDKQKSLGGSLMSIGTFEKRKGFKKFAKSIGSKLNLTQQKNKHDTDNVSLSGSVSSLKRRVGVIENSRKISQQIAGDADPGVISDEDDDFRLDELSVNSSHSTLNQSPATKKKGRSLQNLTEEVSRRHTFAVLSKNSSQLNIKSIDEWKQNEIKSKEIENLKIIDLKKNEKKHKEGSTLSKIKNFRRNKNSDSKNNLDRIVIGEENEDEPMKLTNNKLSKEILQKFNGKSREDLILLICQLQSNLDIEKMKSKDLENYIDDLLLRVMETTPRILQTPYIN